MVKAVKAQWSSGHCFNHHLNTFPKCLIISIPPGMLLDCANSYCPRGWFTQCHRSVLCFGSCAINLDDAAWEGRHLSMRKHAVLHHMAAEQGSSCCLFYWSTTRKSCVPKFPLRFDKSQYLLWVVLSIPELIRNQILIKKNY